MAAKYFARFGRDRHMSKIGRKPISLGGVKVEVKGQEVHFSGKQAQGIYHVPEVLNIELKDNQLYLTIGDKNADVFNLWGLHRALLANKIIGADQGFKKQVRIVGLGYKAIPKGTSLEFSLGFSHKIMFPLPQGVTVDIDKTGQLLTFQSVDKQLLGSVCSEVCLLRPTEPYKGTGVHCEGDVIRRKAGKAKA